MSDPLLSVQEAQTRILATIQPGKTETIHLDTCHGRVLAEDVFSPIDLPPFDNSSMDGFAIQAADIVEASLDHPVRLPIAFHLPAGKLANIALQAGQTARIMTGAMLPKGADAVVPVEDTNFAPGLVQPDFETGREIEVEIYHPASRGTNIRPKGQDVHTGQRLFTAGRKLQPQDIGMLAATGKAFVQVYQKPKIALFSSGDELTRPGQSLEAGQIYDSNQFTLAAMLEKQGAEVIRLGITPDAPDRIQALLNEAVQDHVDLIVTSAGVSVGAFDYVRQVIQSNGNITFWKVNMRPGKPLVYGNYGHIPVIGLPGNPVSAYVGCRVFIFPVIDKLSGRRISQPSMRKAILAEAIESDGRESYLRGVVQHENNRMVARLSGHQGSGNLFSLVQANALLIVPSGVKSLPSDSEIDYWYLDAE